MTTPASPPAALVLIPLRRYVGIPVASAALVGAAVVALCLGFWPDRAVSAALGAAVGAGAVGLGSLAIAPWMPRTTSQWGVVTLAGHGLTIMIMLASSLLLYSAARPDALAFLVAVAAPFPVAMVAQAALALGPALRTSQMDEGQAAHTTDPGPPDQDGHTQEGRSSDDPPHDL